MQLPMVKARAGRPRGPAYFPGDPGWIQPLEFIYQSERLAPAALSRHGSGEEVQHHQIGRVVASERSKN